MELTSKSISRFPEKEKESFQILAVMLACLSAYSTGILFSWPSPSIIRIIAENSTYDISFEETSYFTVISPIGMILSCVIFSRLVDIIGRKWMLLSIVIPQITCWILTATAKSVYVFYIARFIAGIGDACLFASVPTYVGEIATPKVRGTWGNAMTFFIYFGQFTINVIGSYFSIVHTAYIGLIVPVVFACGFIFMPESPYYLLMKNRDEEARHSLQKLRRKFDVEAELKQIKKAIERQMSESGSWKDLFTIASNRRAIFAGAFLRGSQQLAGVGAFALYTQYIFLKAGGNVAPQAASMIFMSLCAGLNLCASFTVEIFGRRKSYFYSCLFSGLVLLSESIYFAIDQIFTDVDLSAVRWFPLAGMILYMIFFSFGVGIVPTLMLGELFSASIKGKGLCLMNIVFGFLLSTVTKLFQVLEVHVGLFAPFLLFSICCLASTVLSLHFVPETKGRTLEEIQQSLKNPKQKEVNSSC